MICTEQLEMSDEWTELNYCVFELFNGANQFFTGCADELVAHFPENKTKNLFRPQMRIVLLRTLFGTKLCRQ